MHDPDGPTPKPASTWGNVPEPGCHNVRYRTPVEAHLKAWLVEGTPPAVLTGSANLTSAGLFNNREVMVEARGPDSASTNAKVRDLVADAWDYKQKLIEVIERPQVGSRPVPPLEAVHNA